MSTEQVAFIFNPNSHITVAYPHGEVFTVTVDEHHFHKVVEHARHKDWNKVYELLTINSRIVGELHSEDQSDDCVITIEHGVVRANGDVVHNTVCERIIKNNALGFDVAPMKLFLKNLLSNPSRRAVQELYGFLESSNLPITDDGHFLAYKRIRSDWTDIHSGTMDNSIGSVVSMRRNEVNDDKDQTCSAGLHFCALSYLQHFNGDRVVVVKINPADVVSIPVDYQNAKGRACRYTVLRELKNMDTNNDPVERLEDMVVVNTSPEVSTKSDDHVTPHMLVAIDAKTNVVTHQYTSVEEAASYLGIPASYIKRVLSGDRATTGGYMWKWQEAENQVQSANDETHAESIHNMGDWLIEDDDDDFDDDDEWGW